MGSENVAIKFDDLKPRPSDVPDPQALRVLGQDFERRRKEIKACTGKYRYTQEEWYEQIVCPAYKESGFEPPTVDDHLVPERYEDRGAVPTREEAKERLDNPAESKADAANLTEEDWLWIERASHPLGKLYYSCGFTPEFLELDIRLNITNHACRLYQYVTLHCDMKMGESEDFKLKDLAAKLKCKVRDIRRAMKKLNDAGVARYSIYPENRTEKFKFYLPCVDGLPEVINKAKVIKDKTGVSVRKLWENREKYGFPVKCGGETEAEGEGEGVAPPSTS